LATIAALFDFEEGHFFTNFKLAKDLQERGHRFCYLGPASAEPMVRRQGLELIPVFEQLLGTASRSSQALARTRESEWFGQLIRGEALDRVIQEVEPDLMLMLSLYYAEALAVQIRYRLPIVLWTTFCRPSKLTRADLAEDRVSNRLMSLKSSDLDATLQAASAAGYRFSSFKELAKLVLRMPELVALPRAIELPDVPADPGIFYVGTGIDPNRRDEPFDWGEIAGDRYLIYCSLGSQAELERDVAVRFFRAVLGAAASHPDWQLILSVGKGFDLADLAPVPPNVLLKQWVPQLEILKRADLMVTHGGPGTVKECVLAGVPMVVMPLMRDQFEMAKRAVHHRLGATGNLAEVTAETLGSLIEGVAADGAVEERISAMRQLFLEEDRANLGVDVIEAVLAGVPPAKTAFQSGIQSPILVPSGRGR
jgi:MGT family glycosyltransferase